MRYWIYIHTCPNGKKYVGITTKDKPEYRWRKGTGYQKNEHFYSAILKYGWDNITHEAWELSSETELYYAEKYLISYFRTDKREFGYNNTSGGELGKEYTPETREKMSKALKGRTLSEEWKIKISISRKGQKPSEETRKLWSLQRTGKHHTPETRQKMRESQLGVPKPKPLYRYTLPDGTFKIMSPQNASRNYLKKGIRIEKGPRVI